jgi:hypothetical protein
VQDNILNTLLPVETALRKDIEVKGAKAPFFYAVIAVLVVLTVVREFAAAAAAVFVA